MKFKDYFKTAKKGDVFKMGSCLYKVSKIFRNKLFAWEYNKVEEIEISANDDCKIHNKLSDKDKRLG